MKRLSFLAQCLAATGLLTMAAASAQAQTTTLGTRTVTNTANTAVTNNATATWKNYTRPELYPNTITLPLQFITLSSGKKLAVLVSVPADSNGKQIPGKFPVILNQNAYRIDLGQLMGGIAPKDPTLIIGGKDKYMIQRGYINVAVDVYGTGMSGGVTKLLGEEEQQGYKETVDWVTRQSWFNGNLGLAGTSYLGIASLLTAEQQNPAVKAVYAEVPMGDIYRTTGGTGGMLNALFFGYWLVLTQNLSVTNEIALLLHPDFASQINSATADHAAAINQWYFPMVNQALADKTGVATDDGNFWAVRSPMENISKIKVPTFIVGASNDIFQRDEPLLYEQLKQNGVNTKLLIYPGSHFPAVLDSLTNKVNTTSYGPPSSEDIMLQWFDQYLQGRETGAATLPNVTQYVQGYATSGQRFARATDWPHPQMQPQRLYLRGNMMLSNQAPTAQEASHTITEPTAPTVTLSTTIDGKKAKAKVTINDGSDCSISNVQWTLGIDAVLGRSCYKEDATVENAQKALVFETPTLTSDLYINGPIQADIWMSTTKTQAALSVRIDDVDASGTVTPITNGLQSAAYRAVDTSRSRYVNGVMIQPWHPYTEASVLPVVPGQAMLVPVEIFPTAALVRAGHKLRVAISASNQAQGIWPLPKQAQANGNVSTILNDGAHQSSVVLPVVPASALN